MSAISYTVADRVGTIRITRPERRNALNHRALGEMHDAVRRAREDGLGCLVLSGSEGHFCAGADLTELEDMAFTQDLRRMLDDLAALPFPTIAAISGSCMGLGVQLALACDLRLTTPEARFAVPVAKLGLMVDHWTIRRLSLCAGHSTARWLLLTASPIGAEAAVRSGLVQQLVPVGDSGRSGRQPDAGATVLPRAHDLARSISKLAPLSLSGSKLGLDLVERSLDGAEGDPVDPYREAFEAAWASDDLAEGRRAFSGAPPRVQGR
ncbi:MAG: enoyl-CoA hydratase-related protein [Microthrixaceae bacterium]